MRVLFCLTHVCPCELCDSCHLQLWHYAESSINGLYLTGALKTGAKNVQPYSSFWQSTWDCFMPTIFCKSSVFGEGWVPGYSPECRCVTRQSDRNIHDKPGYQKPLHFMKCDSIQSLMWCSGENARLKSSFETFRNLKYHRKPTWLL